MAVAHCPEDRWAWLEIDRTALRHNLVAYQQGLSPRTQIMAVMKANAYGHGAVECAKVFRNAGATQFGVATVSEAIELRKYFPGTPILILNEPPISAVKTLLEYQLMPTVHSIEFALAYGEAAALNNAQAPYHLALDTGMSRNGVAVQDALEFLRSISFHAGLTCAGTFTHFATADVPEDWDFELQLNRFDEAVEAMRQVGFDPGILHAANAAAVVRSQKSHYDMVRLGIGLYGLYPNPALPKRIELHPAMSVHARVSRTAFPAVGAGVSYGMKYRVPKANVQICTVPLGYADGYHRALEGSAVLCHENKYSQVGAICMDHLMFAVEVNTAREFGSVRPVEVGDEVVLVGRQGEHVISMDDIAAKIGTINYEAVCDFGMRLKHVYV